MDFKLSLTSPSFPSLSCDDAEAKQSEMLHEFIRVALKKKIK